MNRVEKWKGHEIRFVERSGEWWAVAADVCAALGLSQVTRALKGLAVAGVTISKVGVVTGEKRNGEPSVQGVDFNIIDERNIYRLVFKSRRPEALLFQDWVYDTIQQLRKATGLEAFQVFRMLDKEHQRQTMKRLHDRLESPTHIDYVKANTIANKAVSMLHGNKRMVRKADMSPGMLIDRQRILDDTVELMTTREKFGLTTSVSKAIYCRYGKGVAQ